VIRIDTRKAIREPSKNMRNIYKLSVLACLGALTACQSADVERQPFTLAIIPDTQHYADRGAATGGKIPDLFTPQTQWIVGNHEKENIVFVLHEGDIVQQDNEVEWERANASLSLLDGVVPYIFCRGGHDDSGLLNRYFPVSRYEHEEWFGGSMPGDPDNRYVTFSAGGMQFMIITLEWRTPPEVFEWANRIVASHKESRVIVLLNNYLSHDNKRHSLVEYIWQDFIRRHKNIFLVLSGNGKQYTPEAGLLADYGDGAGRLTSRGIHGNPVHQVLANYEMLKQGGNGWLRLMRFIPLENKIEVTAWSPWLQQSAADVNEPMIYWRSDLESGAAWYPCQDWPEQNHFELDYDMSLGLK
jgi:hypothetical protein